MATPNPVANTHAGADLKSSKRLQLGLVVAALGFLAWWFMASPLRGHWVGSFDGSVAGTVEFRIGIRGTAVTGKLVGTTSSGEPFTADLEGRVSGGVLSAAFVGSSRGGPLGIQFRGTLEGELDPAGQAPASGSWRCVLERGGTTLADDLAGSWQVARPPT